MLENSTKTEFKHCGLKCEIIDCYQDFIGAYYCGYVYLKKPLSEDELENIKDKFSDEITFESVEKIGIDTAHAYNFDDNTNHDFDFVQGKVSELAELVKKLKIQKGKDEK